MKNRLNNEKETNCLFENFKPDLDKILKSQLNYNLRNQNPFSNYLFNYDQYLPCSNSKYQPNNRFNPHSLNFSPVNYDHSLGSWLKVVFFQLNTMKIKVVDKPFQPDNRSVNSSNLSFVNNDCKNEKQFIIGSNEKIILSPNYQSQKINLVNNNNLVDKNNLANNNNLVNSKQILFTPNDYAWLKHLFAGATAGVASRTCTAPLDRIKVLLQVRGHEIKSIRSCYRFIKEEGGYRSFWRGNGINCLKIAPEIAFRFMFYEQIKRYIKGDSNRQLAIYERLISGSLAGSLSQSIIYPMEVVKTRLCLRATGQYNGILDAMKKIYKIEGYRTFYRGFCVNLAGILPYSGIDLTVYETLKNFYLDHFQNEDPSVLVVLVCGITSNISGQLFSYPLALIRTRLQASNDKNVSFNTIRRKIFSTSGLLGFYKGFGPNLIKVAPANAITYIVYEQIRQIFHVKMS